MTRPDGVAGTTPGADTRKIGVWVHAGVLSALGAAFFAPGLFSGQIPIFRDLLVLALPLRRYTADALRHGEIPLWIPEIFFGAPYLANYQSGVLYPPSLILLAPFPAGFSLYLAFHVVVGAIGASLYLERVTGLAPPAAMLGGVVFAFGGFFFSLVSLANQLAAAAWLPWVLMAADRFLSVGGPGAFAVLSLLAALQLLAGAPEAVVLTAALLAAGLIRLLWTGVTSLRAVALLGGAFILAAGISAAQLLPTWEYVRLTSRAGGLPLSEVVAESLGPVSLLQLVLPHTFEGGAPGFMPEGGVPLFWSLYLGVIPLVLVIAGLPSRPSVFWIGVALFAALFAAGDRLPLFPALHSLAPHLMGAFRYPGKAFLLAHFALAVITALGMRAVLESGAARAVALVTCLCLAVLGIGISSFATSTPQEALAWLGYDLRPGLAPDRYEWVARQVSTKGLRLAALAAVSCGVIGLFSRARIGAPVFAGLLVVATFVDLFTVHQPSLVFTDWESLRRAGAGDRVVHPAQRVFHYRSSADGGLAAWVGTIRVAESVEERGRALFAARIPDLPVLDGGVSVAGVDGFTPHERIDFYRALAALPAERGLRLLAALGTERVVGPEPLEEPGAVPVVSRDEPTLHVYDLAAPAPRTYLAERALSAADRLGSLARLSSAGFRPGRDVVLIGPEDLEEALGGGIIEEVSFTRTVIRARVSLDAPGLWVVSDTWYPGWECSIDGEPAEILPVNGIVRGVRVPAGTHFLEMRYRPGSFRLGAAISLATLMLLLPSSVLAARLAKPGPPDAPR